jgi:predicted PurR-regulated permease PerM
VTTYFVITAKINFGIGISSIILLWILGIPYAILWGIISFIFGFIPYVGYYIALLPPLILAFAIGGIGYALIVVFGYWAINAVFSSLIAPRMYGKGLNLSVTLTLVTVLFWGWVLGAIGGLLAVPLTALIRSVLLASYPDTVWLATMMSDSSEEGAQTKA